MATTATQQAKPTLKFIKYRDEKDIEIIKALMDEDLSEPYSIYTYRYFVNQWPSLTFLAYDINDEKNETLIGAIVCKLDDENPAKSRGYIGMLAIDKKQRKKGLGSLIVSHAIEELKLQGCIQVYLETEVINTAALRLYENLGFVKDKRLSKYYLNGGDAFRLKLWLQPKVHAGSMNNLLSAAAASDEVPAEENSQ